MKVLSFDCGIKNLAYCLLDVAEDTTSPHTLLDWQVITLQTSCKHSDVHALSTALFGALEDRFKDILASVDVVLIENQPCMKNPIMKTVQILLYSFFKLKGVPQMVFVSASRKLAVKHRPSSMTHDIKQKISYAQKKSIAIQITTYHLGEPTLVQCSPDIHTAFRTSKKKDDLSDCYLQAVAWLESVRYN